MVSTAQSALETSGLLSEQMKEDTPNFVLLNRKLPRIGENQIIWKPKRIPFVEYNITY